MWWWANHGKGQRQVSTFVYNAIVIIVQSNFNIVHLGRNFQVEQLWLSPLANKGMCASVWHIMTTRFAKHWCTSHSKYDHSWITLALNYRSHVFSILQMLLPRTIQNEADGLFLTHLTQFSQCASSTCLPQCTQFNQFTQCAQFNLFTQCIQFSLYTQFNQWGLST